jgi:CHAD domain-containing protein
MAHLVPQDRKERPMPYRLLREDATLEASLRRIAGEELSAALAQLDGGAGPDAAGVHDIRKRIKKLRGLLRLVRPGFADYAAENAALRDTARDLSALRDAEVRIATFDKVAGSPCPPGLARARARLLAHRDEVLAHPAGVEAPRAALARLRERAAGWALTGRDRDILAEGLAATRRKARAAGKAATRTPTIEALHDWRKRAKDHWYQARLLTPVWPDMMSVLAEELSRFTEDLGDHHDLAVLHEMIRNLPAGVVSQKAALDLDRRIADAQTEIEARAFPHGARLFAGEPEAMADLWVRWWRLWRA